MTIKAIFFDQDGVIIDTERDGHRVAFNETFKHYGYDFEWDVDYYHELLQVAGGKERMKHHLHTKGFGVEVKPEDEEQLIERVRDSLTVAHMHGQDCTYVHDGLDFHLMGVGTVSMAN